MLMIFSPIRETIRSNLKDKSRVLYWNAPDSANTSHNCRSIRKRKSSQGHCDRSLKTFRSRQRLTLRQFPATLFTRKDAVYSYTFYGLRIFFFSNARNNSLKILGRLAKMSPIGYRSQTFVEYPRPRKQRKIFILWSVVEAKLWWWCIMRFEREKVL